MKRRFDKEIKLEAVRLVLESKRPVAAVARETSIHENNLRKWIALFKEH